MYEDKRLAVEAYEYVGEPGIGGSCDGSGVAGLSIRFAAAIVAVMMVARNCLC